MTYYDILKRQKGDGLAINLILSSVYRPGLNPNPHIFAYVRRAAERLLGKASVHSNYVSEARSKIESYDAVLLVGGSLDRQVVPLSIECRKRGNPLVFWATDDPYEIDHNLEHLDLVDRIWTNDRSSLAFYPREKSSHLPLAADPDEHILNTLANESEYWYDVSFVGVEFPNRRAIIEQLVPTLRKLRTAIVGPNWSINEDFIIRKRVTNRQASAISNHSLCVLNLARRFSLNNARQIIPSTPGPRTFEVGGCGTVQVISPELPEVEDYYRPSVEMEFCGTIEDMKTRIEDLVSDSVRRKKIAEAAIERTKTSHIYDNRVSQILETLSDLLP